MLCNKEILIAVYNNTITTDDAQYKDPIYFPTFYDLRVDVAFKQGYYCRYHDKDKNKWKAIRTMLVWEEDNAGADLICWFLKHQIRIDGFNNLWG